ncbi:hypothetical protein K461DRAFT_321594 [Myriangium duriaei CBS 260.36]|uniref:Uncharacterized protein n=1 Tax=Myriangium duriaei CBS 260.36 TaxID=1168546 RepID=A0A9P4J583_9PEZI|nr:hypothetical protein K461DRAFT_321594 [Myriangium duriaei CBS 260.36]
MSTPSRSQTPTAAAGRRAAKDASATDATPARTTSTMASRNSTPITSASRSRSVRTPGASTPPSARAAVKKPVNGSSNATNARNVTDNVDISDADSKAQTSAAIEEMQESLRLSQEACEDYQKQIALLQARAADSADEHRKLEETTQELTERLEELENEKRDSLRSKRELEAIYESDRAVSLKFREEAQAKEEELVDTIQRLKDSLAQREFRPGTEESKKPDLSRTASFRSGHSQVESPHFAPSSSLQRSDSRSSSRLVLQKDKIIESLRIELAEAQIKLVEMENLGGGQVQGLEKTLMEARMTNARLMEENESFQLLLSEKTLSGELAHSPLLQKIDTDATPTTAVKGSSLEEELKVAEEGNDDDPSKDFKVQIASLRDENKALTLYINNIISRLLQHDFEFILDKNSEAKPTARPAEKAEKELPPPPADKEAENPGFLARTRSYMGNRRPRPQSAIFTSETAIRTIANENPDTAPSIPIGRPQPRSTSGSGNRRSLIDWNSAAVVNNMYRGPSPTRSSGGPLSPSIASPRNSFFGSRPSNPTRVTSGSTVATINEDDKTAHNSNRDSKIGSSRNSLASDASNSISPPQSTVASSDKAAGSVMVGSKMRPLRLVQETADEAAAKKANNRQSWMGWFNKGT